MDSTRKKIDHLIVDSGGFIRNAPLGSLSDDVVSLLEVVDEIRDKATKERLQMLPYDLKIKSPSSKAIAKVNEFSKKTGDFPALSATDIMVIALTYDYHLQYIGEDTLKDVPTMNKTINFYKPGDESYTPSAMAGFYDGDNNESFPKDSFMDDSDLSITGGNISSSEKDDLAEFSSISYWRDPIPLVDEEISTFNITDKYEFSQCLNYYLSCRSYVIGYCISNFDFAIYDCLSLHNNLHHLKRWSSHVQSYEYHKFIKDVDPQDMKTLIGLIMQSSSISVENVTENLKNAMLNAEIPAQISKDDKEEYETNSYSSPETIEEEIEVETDEDDDDEGGWITPNNIKEKNKMMMGSSGEDSEEIPVAIMTTDFAMQNVSKQLGLRVVSVDGYEIKTTKTWILRCYACYNTTSLMHKKFCQKCGNKTLKRVSVTLNEDGSQQIHISTRNRLTGRGKKFSLPKPVGGKYAINPLLAEDQNLPQQRQTRLARQKTDALSDDYLAGSSPFILRDVNSKSAIVGTPGVGIMNNFYWMKKNPNEVGRGTGNRRKKKNRN
ncbi:RNA-binding protein NOB1 isoform X1 [Lepeophtheirus salmonis]|uniref:RNA-binding protein NOB1 isoform X1 n=1 Tax=Lepeophtheirus salmonis TaxID=72036 RepID=UPI001AE38FFC|nr:RNA-binding protein NOB1-like isoform X1 [Lepeophtheirus salmonis]